MELKRYAVKKDGMKIIGDSDSLSEAMLIFNKNKDTYSYVELYDRLECERIKKWVY